MSYEQLRRRTLISRYPTIPGIIARFLGHDQPQDLIRGIPISETSFNVARWSRYPQIYQSQVVVRCRCRKAWCDRGFTNFVNIPHHSVNISGSSHKTTVEIHLDRSLVPLWKTNAEKNMTNTFRHMPKWLNYLYGTSVWYNFWIPWILNIIHFFCVRMKYICIYSRS